MEKNNPSNPLRTPCKSFAIPRLSRSSESNLPGSEDLSFFLVHRSIEQNARDTHMTTRDGRGTKKKETLFFSSPAAALVSRVERHLAGVHSPYTKCEKKETARSLEEFLY